MIGSETWTKVVWSAGRERRSFLVKSVRGGPIEEYLEEASAGAFARHEDQQDLRDHDARRGLALVEAHVAPEEADEGPVVMQADLPNDERIFFGVDANGAKCTGLSRERSVIEDLLGRTSGPRI